MTLSRQNFAFKRDAATRNSLDNIIGASPAMEKLKQTIRTVASTQSTILIYGESGTGKELVARAVHVCSPRASEPFVSINCGAFPETLLESELFGYVKGAFTGANQNKRGLFEVADQRHDLSRRNRRDDADHAGQTAARAAGAHRAPGGRHRAKFPSTCA